MCHCLNRKKRHPLKAEKDMWEKHLWCCERRFLTFAYVCEKVEPAQEWNWCGSRMFVGEGHNSQNSKVWRAGALNLVFDPRLQIWTLLLHGIVLKCVWVWIVLCPEAHIFVHHWTNQLPWLLVVHLPLFGIVSCKVHEFWNNFQIWETSCVLHGSHGIRDTCTLF